MTSCPDHSDTIAFVAVVKHSGFTSAAQASGTTKARLSRKVRELEERLGTLLLKRSTRRLGLTEAGLRYYEECAPLIEGLARAEETLRDITDGYEGRIVITAPAWFAERVLAPILAELRTSHPNLYLDIISTHSPLDLISDEVDLAFRLWIGALPDSSLVARRLATLPQSVFTSARHIEQHGNPDHPSQLASHPALVTHIRKPAERKNWWLTDGETAGYYAIHAVATASDPAALEALMLAGDGLLLATELQMRGRVADDKAVYVLPGWHGRPVELYAILPSGRQTPRKVRIALELIALRLTTVLSA